ncbi:hypothetical protein [Rugamonas fusca]|uniref:hypothetical protein n=1 Tax=Rugamonas fusca TaxID=2758568 RepID=UPI001E33EE51|nr:hypothetical protein [Rugamonas fusca]
MKYTAPSLHVDLISAGAVVLTMIALSLLWRQHRLRAAMARLQRALLAEQAARAMADQTAFEQRAASASCWPSKIARWKRSASASPATSTMTWDRTCWP